VSEVTRSYRERLSTVAHHLLSAAASRKWPKREEAVAIAVELGGGFAWGADQSAYISEVASMGAVEVDLPPLPPPSAALIPPGYTIDEVPLGREFAVTQYGAFDEAGTPVRILVFRSAMTQQLLDDVRALARIARMAPTPWRRISRSDFIVLLGELGTFVSIDADIAHEVSGIGAACGSNRLAAPLVISRGPGVLIEEAVPGTQLLWLSPAEQASAYCDAVTSWGTMLVEDHILQVGLRRDRIIKQPERLAVTRWAGTRRARPDSVTLLRCLVTAEFGRTAHIRSANREQLSELLAQCLGMTGALTEVSSLCLSLISSQPRIENVRRRITSLTVSQMDLSAASARMELLLLLRQVAWLRDIGLACQVDDLVRPWQDLASAFESS
jgi:hypothetical protein